MYVHRNNKKHSHCCGAPCYIYYAMSCVLWYNECVCYTVYYSRTNVSITVCTVVEQIYLYVTVCTVV
jgi:hypothetical protein